ncbi:MAG: hypothetical protein HY507_01240 [Candidatus Zambryskibacteria bacterium]|nr:hypothetical protein [Candidatus Zambryskibacteria bacterium]
MLDYQYAYLFGNFFILLPIWLLLFFCRKDLKREILTVSMVVGLAGPFSELLYLRDYWHPETFFSYPFGLEGYSFGFFMGGIAAVIYEEIFGKRFSKSIGKTGIWFLFCLLLCFIVAILFFIFLLDINSIYTTSMVMIATALGIIYIRKDLLVDAIVSGLSMGMVMFLSYIIFLYFFPEAIGRWWKIENVSGILVRGIPIEELIWAFGWGMLGGPAYEFFAGLKFQTK